MKTLVFALVTGFTLQNHTHALTKVVEKLEGMLKKSKEDGESDKKTFATFTCESNSTIEDAKAQIEKSTNIIALESGKVEQLRGTNGKLSQEIASLTKQITENEDQQTKATDERAKEKEAYDDKNEDLTGAIGQLGEAIKLLADIGADQTAEDRDTADRDRFVKDEALVAVKAAAKVIPADKQNRVAAFLQAPFSGTYTSQSGEIIGILKNQKDTFENDLDTATKLEEKRKASHEELMEILKADKKAAEESRTGKKGELSQNSEEIGSKKIMIADNEDLKKNNEETLAETTKILAEKTKKYEGRRATRAKEEAAIAKAVAILNSDAAFANKSFSKDAAPVFTQMKRSSTHNPFSTVLAQIGKMIKAIDAEEEADVKKKTWCEGENEQNKNNLSAAETEQTKQEAAINMAQGDLDTAKANLEAAQTEIKTLQDNRKSELQERSEENQRYQALIVELHEAHDILAQAVKVLTEFYNAEETSQSTEDHEYEKQGGAEVITLLEDIQKNTEGQETQAHEDEESDQGEFESTLTNLDQSIADQEKISADERENIAAAEENLLAAQSELARQKEIQKTVEEYAASIKPGCDFIIKNYDTRKGNREEEKKQLEFAKGKVEEREAKHGLTA